MAAGKIVLKKETIRKIIDRDVEKGDVLETARLAGFTAVKQTQFLIPYCHHLLIEHTDFEFQQGENFIEVICAVKSRAKTGLEMEALVGVSLCLSTIWDMVKHLEKDKNGQYPTTQLADIKVIKKEKFNKEKVL